MRRDERFVLRAAGPSAGSSRFPNRCIRGRSGTPSRRASAEAGVVVQAVALIDERDRRPSDARSDASASKRVVQHERRQLPEIPERSGRRDHDAPRRRALTVGIVVGRQQDRRRRDVLELVEHAGDVADRSAGAHAEAEIRSQIERAATARGTGVGRTRASRSASSTSRSTRRRSASCQRPRARPAPTSASSNATRRRAREPWHLRCSSGRAPSAATPTPASDGRTSTGVRSAGARRRYRPTCRRIRPFRTHPRSSSSDTTSSPGAAAATAGRPGRR